MSMKKKVTYTLAALAVLAGIGVSARLWSVLDTSRSDVADNSVRLADFHSTDADAIRRGEYVMRLADCAACHNANFAGGYRIDTPFGALETSNVTPDRQTGIGNMTERDFFNAVRQGKGDHGFLYPAMPYTSYTQLTDNDMHDLWAFFSTVTPVAHEVNENAGMNFPYNIRLAMMGWNLLFFKNEGYSPQQQSQAWNRGKYIVDGPAHCSVCHTARNPLGGEVSGGYLHGGDLGTWYAPDISSDKESGIGRWSEQNIIDYLHTGSDEKSVAAGPMAEAVEHSTQYFTQDDLQSIAVYLRSLPASGSPKERPFHLADAARKQGELAYEVNCSACHGLQGEGIKNMIPAFADNDSMQKNPRNMIHAMLKGTRAPHTDSLQTAAGMPSFAWKMDDGQIADILNYVRNSWGNQASEVTADQVASMRKATDAAEKLKTPAQH